MSCPHYAINKFTIATDPIRCLFSGSGLFSLLRGPFKKYVWNLSFQPDSHMLTMALTLGHVSSDSTGTSVR